VRDIARGRARRALTVERLAARGLDVAALRTHARTAGDGTFVLLAAGTLMPTAIVLGEAIGPEPRPAAVAAAVAADVRRLLAASGGPSDLLDAVNAAIVARYGTQRVIATATCVSIWPYSGRVVWATAGAEAPWSIEAGVPLPTGATPALGVRGALRAERFEYVLPPRAGILLVSHALFDTHLRPEPWPFLDRGDLGGILSERPRAHAAELLRHVCRRVSLPTDRAFAACVARLAN
jgi:hypothetical protein